MAPKCSFQHVTIDYPFMTCLLKVNRRSCSWARTVRKVLKQCEGVHSFKMEDDGVIKVSGTVDPDLLLKALGKAGRKAEVQWLQFGQCSNNLFFPANQTSSNRGYYGSHAYHSKPDYQITYGHNHDYRHAYDPHNYNYGYKYGYNQAYDDGRDYHYGYYDYGCEANKIDYLPSAPSVYAEDMGCCRMM